MNSPQKSQYEKQKNGQWKTLTNPLAQDHTLHSQLNNFLKTIYQKFRTKKNLSPDFKPTIKFNGFQGWQDFPSPTKMGHCDSQLQTAWQTLNGQKVAGSETYSGSLSIVLSQKLLLSKLGMNEFISDYQEISQVIHWSSLPVSFNELIATIAHEIAHAHQFLVNEGKIKSQCESTGERDQEGQLKYPQLAYEHTALTQEIQNLTLKLPEYQKFKNWWEGKELAENILADIPEETKSEKTTDFTAETSPKTSDTSQKSSKEPTNSNQKSELPSWVLPVGIIAGVLLLIGIIYLIFKPKK